MENILLKYMAAILQLSVFWIIVQVQKEHFGDIKENEKFRRFNYRKEEKVYKEFMLYAIGRNINKYHRFLHGELRKFEGKMDEKAA